jgi:hypothetical protein
VGDVFSRGADERGEVGRGFGDAHGADTIGSWRSTL